MGQRRRIRRCGASSYWCPQGRLLVVGQDVDDEDVGLAVDPYGRKYRTDSACDEEVRSVYYEMAVIESPAID